MRPPNKTTFLLIVFLLRSVPGNCAEVKGGAWWYYNCRCFNPTSTYTSAINLTCYGSSQINVTRLQLKIRPALCDAPLKTIHLREMNCGC